MRYGIISSYARAGDASDDARTVRVGLDDESEACEDRNYGVKNKAS